MRALPREGYFRMVCWPFWKFVFIFCKMIKRWGLRLWIAELIYSLDPGICKFGRGLGGCLSSHVRNWLDFFGSKVPVVRDRE